MDKSIAELITYIVLRVRDAEGTLGRTKLIKLLYLIDLEYYRKIGETLTKARWVFWHYGPYFFEFPTVLSSLELDLPEETVTTSAGRSAYVSKPIKGVEIEEEHIERRFGRRAATTIQQVLDRWAIEELNPILDYVYFHTEPMKNAERGQPLDFNSVEKFVTTRRLSSKVDVPQPLKEEFRKRLRQDQRAPTTAMQLEPPANYDNAFFLALRDSESKDVEVSLTDWTIETGEDIDQP